ncbi:family 78 glycoside hydrolase catalytic domain [Nocardioides sp. W7]|uniref:family 78 glycoside hydrolase catalytic domain n=1 Tax=Nocardioides sp. W7 TaxID=2931390 RepID=UPI001FD1FB31|nr:family 78 glycoside hydrolase catalytic domain [Nocardioides sp. W7]
MAKSGVKVALAALAVGLVTATTAPVQAVGEVAYASQSVAPGLVATGLRVDGRPSPLGVDTERPSLSWRLKSSTAGARQTAYRIVVATDADRLGSGPYVWDSGRVESGESIGISYDGPGLEASTRYHWAVQVWDGTDQVSGWSEPGWWETGLLGGDWGGADWISPDTAGALTWDDFTVGVDFTIRSAAAGLLLRAKDADNFYMWQVSTAVSSGAVMLRPHVRVDGQFRNLGEVDLAPVLTPANVGGQHRLEVRVEGDTFTTFVDGTQVDQRQDSSLSGAGTLGLRHDRTNGQDERASFDNLFVKSLGGTDLFSEDFSTPPAATFPTIPVVDGQLAPGSGLTLMSRTPEAPLLRHDFELARPVAEARAYVYGLGLYELSLNGETADDRRLTPTSGQYENNLFYDTYDVTEAVREGANAVGLTLANGYGARYNGYAWRYLGDKVARMLLEVTYTDGSTETVTTSDDWTWSTGPVVANDMYDGEVYDARAERHGWDTAGYDDAGWLSVAGVDGPEAPLVANPGPDRRVVQTLRPVSVSEPTDGVFVFDLGQNISGWTRLHVEGPSGTAVTMRTAEEVYPDGRLDTRTNRSAKATDTYVLKGDGPESWEPRFVYHGFRYVQVTGYPGTPTLEDLDGRVVQADVESTGSFESSDELLNQIWENNRWAIRNNSMSTPTDTPVRDERTPPAMDVQAYKDAAVREFDMGPFYAKYLLDMPPGVGLPQDAHKSQYPDMAGGQVSLAWTLYEQYGDVATLRHNYPAMKAFVDRNVADFPGYVWTADTGLGDWCPPVHGDQANGGMGGPGAGDCTSETRIVNTALWYVQARDVAQAAEVLGNDADAAHFAQVADRIKDAFNETFLDAGGDSYGSGRMTTSVLPLAFGMVPEENVDAVGDTLVRTIVEDNGGHLDTGIFGTRHLFDALQAIGRVDVAMTVLGQRSYPSFGFQIDNGATTPWEQWMYDAGMITHDHAMFAGINASLYTGLGGIQPDGPAYSSMTISPEVPESLDWVRVKQDTVRGTVSSSWRRADDGLVLDVTVPANTTATVEVPTVGFGSGKVQAPDGAVAQGATDDGRAVFGVGSGEYRFTVGVKDPTPGGDVVSTGAPTVSGTTAVGRTLGATTGTWNRDGLAFTYQWSRNGAPVAGATAPTYAVRAADIGSRLRVRVTATSTSGLAGTADSAQTGTVRKVATRTTLRSSRTKVRAGQEVRLRILVTSKATEVRANGRVRLVVNGHTVRTLTVRQGGAKLQLRLTGHGTKRVRVVYLGSNTTARSTSNVVRVRLRR